MCWIYWCIKLTALVFLEKNLSDLSATVHVLEEARLKFHQKKKRQLKLFCEQW